MYFFSIFFNALAHMAHIAIAITAIARSRPRAGIHTCRSLPFVLCPPATKNTPRVYSADVAATLRTNARLPREECRTAPLRCVAHASTTITTVTTNTQALAFTQCLLGAHFVPTR